MLDIGWTEILLIAVVAVVVIGPKDLPNALREAARWMKKLRGLTREFHRGVDDLVREADLQDIKKTVQSVNPYALQRELEQSIDPTGSLRAPAAPLPGVPAGSPAKPAAAAAAAPASQANGSAALAGDGEAKPADPPDRPPAP